MELDRGSFLEREKKNTAKPTHTAKSTSNMGYNAKSTQSQTWASVSLEWRTLGLS